MKYTPNDYKDPTQDGGVLIVTLIIVLCLLFLTIWIERKAAVDCEFNREVVIDSPKPSVDTYKFYMVDNSSIEVVLPNNYK